MPNAPEDVECRLNSNDGAPKSIEMPGLALSFEHQVQNGSLNYLLMGVNCSNVVSWQEVTTSVPIISHNTVLEAITVPEPGIFLPDEKVEMTLSIEVYDGTACVIWEFGQGIREAVYGPDTCCKGLDKDAQEAFCDVPFENEIVHTKTFTDTQTGTYNINVTARNEFMSDTVTVKFGVLPFECDPPSITLTSQGKLRIYIFNSIFNSRNGN